MSIWLKLLDRRLRSIGLSKGFTVINHHDHTNSRNPTELPRRKHRDANAAVTGGRSGNQWAAMNGYALIDVTRVVEQSERAFSPTINLAVDLEIAGWSDSLTCHAAFGKILTRA